MEKDMTNSRITPINRNNKFFSEEDFMLEIEMGREAIEGDGNFTLILYRVDRKMTDADALYGEASKDGIRFFPPVEIKVIPILAEPENKSYNSNSSGRYIIDGNLKFGVYTSQLTELNAEISYGDYIGYPVTENEIRYYVVTNDGIMNFDNKHTIMGYKGAFRTIQCTPADSSEFRGV